MLGGFIYYHPRFMLRERHEIHCNQLNAMRSAGFMVTQDRGGKCWREWRHMHRHAIETNLSIFYAKVNAKGKVNDNPALNIRQECWLEFGSVEWGYASEWHNDTDLMEFHDINLDCGGRTFDEALVNLAKLVLKKYGDYRDRKGREGPCGKPVCADCVESQGVGQEDVGEAKRGLRWSSHGFSSESFSWSGRFGIFSTMTEAVGRLAAILAAARRVRSTVVFFL